MRSPADPHEAIVHGAVKSLRPKLMTVTAGMVGLMPITWSIGTGADVMKRIAAPMVGDLATSFLLELLVYPPVYSGSLFCPYRSVNTDINKRIRYLQPPE